jgi:excisionase family DNA binding protein
VSATDRPASTLEQLLAGTFDRSAAERTGRQWATERGVIDLFEAERVDFALLGAVVSVMAESGAPVDTDAVAARYEEVHNTVFALNTLASSRPVPSTHRSSTALRPEGAAVASQLLRIETVAKALDLSRSAVYAVVARGDLPVVRIGRSVRVRRTDLDAFIERLAAGEGQ